MGQLSDSAATSIYLPLMQLTIQADYVHSLSLIHHIVSLQPLGVPQFYKDKNTQSTDEGAD